MQENLQRGKLIEAFVFLVAVHRHPEKFKKLMPEGVEILSSIVAARGFKSRRLVLGRIMHEKHHMLSEGEDATYPINSYCPFKVVMPDGTNDPLVTHWLDELVRGTAQDIQRSIIRYLADYAPVIARVVVRLDETVPLEPIPLGPGSGYNFRASAGTPHKRRGCVGAFA